MMTGDFLNNVLDFNKDLINEESIELAEPYQRMEDYNFEAAKNVCGNVAGLLSWTVNLQGGNLTDAMRLHSSSLLF